MALVVGTNSYVTAAEIAAYATARGVTIEGDVDSLGLQAMDYIETREYSGERYDTLTNQPLQFPRTPTDQDDAETVPANIETTTRS